MSRSCVPSLVLRRALLLALLLTPAAGGTVAADDAAPPMRSLDDWQAELAAPEVGRRQQAAYALARLGPGGAPAASALALALRDPDRYVREVAAGALAALAVADPSAAVLRPCLPALLAALEDGRPEVRREAVGLLFRAGNPPPPLDAALLEPLRRGLRDADAAVRASAAACLGQLVPAGTVARADLAGALADADADVRVWAATALASLGPAEHVQALRARLADAEPKVRAAVVGALGDLALLPDVVGRLDDPAPSVRAAAAATVQVLGWRARAARPALEARAADADAGARAAAVTALGSLGDAQAVPTLRAALADAATEVRAAAAVALGDVGPEGLSAAAELGAALGDVEPGVRLAAAVGLARHGARARAAARALEAALADPDAAVRSNVLFLLGRIGAVGEAGLRWIVRHLEGRPLGGTELYAAQALGGLGAGAGPALPALAASLAQTRDPDLRFAAAGALARLGPLAREAASAVRAAAAAPAPPVTALEALVALELGPEDARRGLEGLIAALGDPGRGSLAVGALMRLGPRAASAAPALAARTRPSEGTPDLWAAAAWLATGSEGAAQAEALLREALDGPGSRAAFSALLAAPGAAQPLAAAALRCAAQPGHPERALALALLAALAREGKPPLPGTAEAARQASSEPDPAVRLAAADLRDALGG